MDKSAIEILLGPEEVKKILFQRGAYLLIDGVLGCDLTSFEKTLTASYQVPMIPPWLTDHVLDEIPLMPGTDIIHCGLQAAAILFHLIKKGKYLSVINIDRTKFHDRVTIGETLIIKIRLISISERGGEASFSIYKQVDGQEILVCEGQAKGLLWEKRKEIIL